MLTLFNANSIYIIIVYAILLAPVLAVEVIASWRVLEKTGEKGWKALIPFYGKYTQFKQVWDKNAYWFALIFDILYLAIFWMMLHPENLPDQVVWGGLIVVTYIIDRIFYIVLQIHLSKAFNHNGKFALGLIFVHIVFMCILGFGRAEYIGIQPLRAKKQGRFSTLNK